MAVNSNWAKPRYNNAVMNATRDVDGIHITLRGTGGKKSLTSVSSTLQPLHLPTKSWVGRRTSGFARLKCVNKLNCWLWNLPLSLCNSPDGCVSFYFLKHVVKALIHAALFPKCNLNVDEIFILGQTRLEPNGYFVQYRGLLQYNSSIFSCYSGNIKWCSFPCTW